MADRYEYGRDHQIELLRYQLEEHMKDHRNPHGNTRATVGLSEVQNIAPEKMPVSEKQSQYVKEMAAGLIKVTQNEETNIVTLDLYNIADEEILSTADIRMVAGATDKADKDSAGNIISQSYVATAVIELGEDKQFYLSLYSMKTESEAAAELAKINLKDIVNKSGIPAALRKELAANAQELLDLIEANKTEFNTLLTDLETKLNKKLANLKATLEQEIEDKLTGFDDKVKVISDKADAATKKADTASKQATAASNKVDAAIKDTDVKLEQVEKDIQAKADSKVVNAKIIAAKQEAIDEANEYTQVAIGAALVATVPAIVDECVGEKIEKAADEIRKEVSGKISEEVAKDIKPISDKVTALENKDKTLEADIDTLKTKVADLTEADKTLAGKITKNTQDIATNVTAIATNKANIATNTSDISKIKTDINSLKAKDTELETAVNKNTGDISTNTANIAANKTNIENNTSDISTLKSDVADLKTADETLDEKISDVDKALDDYIKEHAEAIAKEVDTEKIVLNGTNLSETLATFVDTIKLEENKLTFYNNYTEEEILIKEIELTDLTFEAPEIVDAPIDNQMYLYKKTYEDLDYEAAYAYFEDPTTIVPPTGCSSIRVGNFVGRNLDWNYNNDVNILIRTIAKDGRYATQGITGSVSGLTKAFVDSGKYSDMYKIAPFRLVDGMNEKGLVVNVNVVPISKLAEGETFDDLVVNGSTEQRICQTMLVRYLLDHCATIAECKEEVKKLTIFPNKSLAEAGFEAHIMLNDLTGCTVIEFQNGVMYFVDLNDGYVEDSLGNNYSKSELANKMFMTNFRLINACFDTDGKLDCVAMDAYEPHAAGIERYELMIDTYESIEEKDDMKDMMEKLHYSHAYLFNDDYKWYSEFVGSPGRDGTDLTVKDVETNLDNFRIGDYQYLFNNRSRDAEGVYITWNTNHTTVFDLENKTFAVSQQEINTYYDNNGGKEQQEITPPTPPTPSIEVITIDGLTIDTWEVINGAEFGFAGIYQNDDLIDAKSFSLTFKQEDSTSGNYSSIITLDDETGEITILSKVNEPLEILQLEVIK